MPCSSRPDAYRLTTLVRIFVIQDFGNIPQEWSSLAVAIGSSDWNPQQDALHSKQERDIHMFFPFAVLTVLGMLRVRLIRVTDLRDTDPGSLFVGKSDPYVKFHLEQDNWIFDKSYGKTLSSTKSNERSPEFDEVFTFRNVPEGLDNMVLNVQVMDDDVVSMDDKLGSCRIKLERMRLTEDPRYKRVVVSRRKARTPWWARWIPFYRWLFMKRPAIHLELSYYADD